MAADVFMSKESNVNDFTYLFMKPVGTVVKIPDKDYETVLRRLEDLIPTDLEFELTPINPGTSLFTLYGPEHCIVTKRAVLE